MRIPWSRPWRVEDASMSTMQCSERSKDGRSCCWKRASSSTRTKILLVSHAQALTQQYHDWCNAWRRFWFWMEDSAYCYRVPPILRGSCVSIPPLGLYTILIQQTRREDRCPILDLKDPSFLHGPGIHSEYPRVNRRVPQLTSAHHACVSTVYAT